MLHLTHYVPAAHVTRRRFVAALPAVGVAALPPTSASAVPELPDVNCENPEPLRLSGKLSAMTDRFLKVDKRRLAIMRTWGPRWPKTPEALIGQGNEIDRDLAGNGIMVRNRYGEEQAQHIATVENLQFGIGQARRVLKGRSIDSWKNRGMGRADWEQELAHMLRLEACAAPHEAERERIRELSRYPSVNKEWWATKDAIAGLITAIMAETARTSQDVLIQARTLAQWGAFVYFMRFAGEWGQSLARSVLGPKAFVIAVA